MAPRMLRVLTGGLLGGSGALMFAASWERWASECTGPTGSAGACEVREDHLYDFLPPMEPWEPTGSAAELAGLSLLVLATALPLLPWALTARRPGPYSAVALIASELALVAVGLATLRSGLSGEVVSPPLGNWSVAVWLIVPPILVGRCGLGRLRMGACCGCRPGAVDADRRVLLLRDGLLSRPGPGGRRSPARSWRPPRCACWWTRPGRGVPAHLSVCRNAQTSSALEHREPRRLGDDSTAVVDEQAATNCPG